eukprot:2276301-Rhodomonas_salina.1
MAAAASRLCASRAASIDALRKRSCMSTACARSPACIASCASSPVAERSDARSPSLSAIFSARSAYCTAFPGSECCPRTRIVSHRPRAATDCAGTGTRVVGAGTCA